MPNERRATDSEVNYDPAANAFPKMLYKETESDDPMIKWEGRKLEHCLVDNEVQEAAARKDGWKTADELDGKAKAKEAPASKEIEAENADLKRLLDEAQAQLAELTAPKPEAKTGKPDAAKA